jgi:hypothetical protein
VGTNRLVPVVLFFEIMLVVSVVVISWFALYTLYRLITDESCPAPATIQSAAMGRSGAS